VGGGTYQGLLKHLIMSKDEDDFEKLAASGDRKQLDLLIGDVVNEIGTLHPEVTASNFAKARNLENLSQNDIAASISNMIGEVIGTISYLNALLCSESEVFFLGRVTLNDVVKSGVEDRLKLANVRGLFKQNREYGNVLGALSYIQTK
jgi:type II pantothenate kinase